MSSKLGRGEQATTSIQQIVERQPPPANEKDAILHKKQRIMADLQEILAKEMELKLQTIQTKERSPKPRSVLTSDNLDNLKSLLARQHRLERQLQRKDKQIKQQQEKLRQEQYQRQEAEKQEHKNKKRSQVMKKLQQLESRKLKRQRDYEDTKQRLQNLKQQNYLYAKAQKQIKQQLDKQYEEKLQKMEEQRKKWDAEIRIIHEHQENYDRIKKQKQEERTRKLSQLRSKSEYIKPQGNIYSEITRQQRELIKKSLMEHNESPRKFKQRMEKYDEQTRQIRKQRLSKQIQGKTKISDEKLPPITTAPSTQSTMPEIKPLNRTEMLKLGDQYLHKAKLKRKRGASLTSIPTESSTQLHYNDYMRERLPKYNVQKDHVQIERIRKLMESPDKNRLNQAIGLASKLQSSAVGYLSERLANSIQAKLLILNHMH